MSRMGVLGVDPVASDECKLIGGSPFTEVLLIKMVFSEVVPGDKILSSCGVLYEIV